MTRSCWSSARSSTSSTARGSARPISFSRRRSRSTRSAGAGWLRARRSRAPTASPRPSRASSCALECGETLGLGAPRGVPKRRTPLIALAAVVALLGAAAAGFAVSELTSDEGAARRRAPPPPSRPAGAAERRPHLGRGGAGRAESGRRGAGRAGRVARGPERLHRGARDLERRGGRRKVAWAAARSGLEAGLLRSDDYMELGEGFWLVFAGRFKTRRGAERQAAALGDATRAPTRSRSCRRLAELPVAPEHTPERARTSSARVRARARRRRASASIVAATRRGERVEVVAALEHRADRRARVAPSACRGLPSRRTRRSSSAQPRAGRRGGRRSPPRSGPAPARTARAAGITTCSTSAQTTSSPEPGGHRQVDREALALARADVVERAGARIERLLVDAREQHLARLVEDRVGPVAVVHVPVEDEHPLDAERVERVPGGDGDVGEQAEAHRARRARRGGPAGAAREKPDPLAAAERARPRARTRRPPRAAPPRRSPG